MSQPKVFEFAKEIGLTPIALMDKIREWHLPVKSHMAELEPEVLDLIKQKLSETSQAQKTAKPKKIVAKKSPTAAKEKISSPKATSTMKKKSVGAPVVTEEKTVPSSPIIRRRVAETAEEVETVDTAVAGTLESAEEGLSLAEETVETASAEGIVSEKIEATASSEVPPVVIEEEVPVVKQPAPAPIIPSRKKEVVVGTSGVASSSTPASLTPKRNIIGKMDLSRVSSNQQRGERPQSPGARQGGFSSPSRPGQNRNIRTGFISASSIQEPDIIPTSHHSEDFKHRELDKKAKKLSGAAPSTREREEEVVQVFNAVEFRKREMVFQPKKKKEDLGRQALKTQITQAAAHKRVLKVYGEMKLSVMAQEMGIKAPQIVKALMQNGVTANMNTTLDFDTIALIVPEFGWEAQNVQKTAEEVATATAFGNMEAELISRPPVVTVMGHVDHGKTSLLDAIRNANVAAGEAGGITQHIGAYSVKIEDGTLITFLDTPGHEAFTAMRARGANATDIAVIVVAADDGMMPQTAEAINHAKAANVPIIIAINKMDKPGANPERIKQQLTEYEIVPEEWGGSNIFVPVSAIKREGIKELLESIKLVAEMLDVKVNPLRSGTGLVIEAKMEKGKGPVATLLVKDGTVKVGQYIVAGAIKGRVRSLMNDRGERVNEALPGTPVEVLGLDGVPNAGDRFDIVVDEDSANKVVELRKEVAAKSAEPSKLSLEDIFSKVQKGDVKELSIILKADVQGSLEAIKGMIQKASANEVKTKVIHAAVGAVTESDILLAHTSKGIVIAFNVRPDVGAQAKAKQLGIDVRTYSVVYELMDDLKKAMAGLLTPDIVEKVTGHAEVRNTFNVPKIGTIAGCFVSDGKILRSHLIRLLRDGKIIYQGKIGSLKRFKDDAKEVASGFECGISIENFNDIKVGDVMETYIKEEVLRELTTTSEAST